jgi:hypothetical protein
MFPIMCTINYVVKVKNSSLSSSSSTQLSLLLDFASPIACHLARSSAARFQLPPSCANRHSTWPEGVLHYVNRATISTLELVHPNGSRFHGWYGQPNATLACYVDDFSSLPDHLVSDSVPHRYSEHSSFHSSLSGLELVDQPQPCRKCPRLGSVYHDR